MFTVNLRCARPMMVAMLACSVAWIAVSSAGEDAAPKTQAATAKKKEPRVLKALEADEFDFADLDSWSKESQVATDPKEDWINTFSTAASREQYFENTDTYRDLTALWMACDPEWIYFRIDCDQMDTLTYGDFLIFLDLGTPDKGSKKLKSPIDGGDLQATWDRGWERIIFLHCWFDFGEQSFYAFHVHDEKGKRVGGYEGRGDPLGSVSAKKYGIVGYEDKAGSIVLGCKREMLGLRNAEPMELNVLVCSLKGGIEQLEKKLEKSNDARFRGDASVVNIADTFGKENTRKRLVLSPIGHDGKTDNNVVKGAVSVVIPAVKK